MRVSYIDSPEYLYAMVDAEDHVIFCVRRDGTIDWVLQLVDGQVPLLVEMKCEDLGVHVCEKADGILKNYRGNYVMESFNPFALLWYRRHRPEICRGQLSMNFQRQEGTYDPQQLIARHLLTNFLAKPDFIAYDIRDKEALSKNICRK